MIPRLGDYAGIARAEVRRAITFNLTFDLTFDFTFDFLLPDIDFDEDSFATTAEKGSQHWKNGKVQAFTLPAQGIYREIDPKLALNEILMWMAISIEGYVKKLAAIECLKKDRFMMSQSQAIRSLTASMTPAKMQPHK